MNIEFELQEEDFLIHQLYNVSKNNKINKRNRLKRFFGAAIYFIFGSYFLFNGNNWLAAIFLGIGFLILVFYPIYLKKKYLNYYKKQLKETVKNRINIPIKVRIDKNGIFTKDKTAESTINIETLKQLIILKDHFLIQLTTGMSLVMPKREIKSPEKVVEKFSEINVPIKNELSWKW